MLDEPYLYLLEDFANRIYERVRDRYPEVNLGEPEIRASVSWQRAADKDIASSIAFKISKILRKNPREIADELFKRAEITGKIPYQISSENGYINARFERAKFSGAVLQYADLATIMNKQDTGSKPKGLVLAEFPSVNPNKPWHIGHLRNALLGDSVSRIMEADGFSVTRQDYIDDLGLQVAESAWGYIKLNSKPDKKFDQWLGEQYVIVNKEMEHENVKEEINHVLKLMEDGNTKEAETARLIAERCVVAQYATAFKYGIYHDMLVWESDIIRERLLEKAIDLLEKKHFIENVTEGKYKGCKIINLSNIRSSGSALAEGLGERDDEAKVLVRSNGAATYLAKDIAFHMFKFGLIGVEMRIGTFIEKQPNGKPVYTTSANGKVRMQPACDMAINVIGSAQDYLQLLLRSAFIAIGMDSIANRIIHLSYGEVNIEGSDLSGRRGGWLGEGRNYTADDLLSVTSSKAAELLQSSKKFEISEGLEDTARKIALSAIKFEFLKISPERRITFSWEKALKFDGETGPYCIYTYARARKVLKNAGYIHDPRQMPDCSAVTEGEDYILIKLLAAKGECIRKAAREFRPDIIADYLIEICSSFSRFYEKYPVLKGGESREFRLELVSSVSIAIKELLALLGIETVESM
jgi:arginyl-tRNA synthetase